MSFTNQLQIVRDDVRAIFKNDPAARSIAEVLLYPGLHALLLHRVAHTLWRRGVPFLPRLISQIARFLSGIEIHPGATIGRGFFIDHGMGVVIGETTEVGDWVMLYQGVTLGGTGKQGGKRHPTLGNRVVVGVGSSVLGDIVVGDGARIGAGSVVLKDVPPGATAVGIPARVVTRRPPRDGETRRVVQMPDPDRDTMLALLQRIEELEETVHRLDADHADLPDPVA